MLKIGEFSKLSQMTVKALRFYEKYKKSIKNVHLWRNKNVQLFG